MKRPENPLLINILAFQVGWFSCVLGAAHHIPWLGPLVTLPVLAWHLHGATYPSSELMLMLIVAVCGSLFDQTLLSLGLIQFAASDWPSQLLPLWMVSLWLLFATALNISLRWMRGRPLIAALFGLIGGPLAFMSGVRMGAMHMLQPTQMLIALGIGWALFMPALSWLSTRLDGYTHTQATHKAAHV